MVVIFRNPGLPGTRRRKQHPFRRLASLRAGSRGGRSWREQNRRSRRAAIAVMACGLCVWAVWRPVAVAQGSEFRGVWADALHSGFKSTSQINMMVVWAQIGNYNAIVAEVLAYQDTGPANHGAYWNSSIVPKAGDISGGIDPLATLIQYAHAAGIEVHAWIVPYRVSTTWPPAGNAYLAARPELTMVPEAQMGGGPAKIESKYHLDPGSPEAQEYIISIVRELVTHYEIDGVHLDYIRYTSTDAGYPADTSYALSGLERFKAITGYVGTPPAQGESSWDDFRRREIDELVRRCRAEIHTIASNPRQPLRFTAALFATGGAPTDFTDSRAYELFQNWPYWMEQGWLDAACPMNYKREHCADQAQWYRSWVDAAINWRYDRHVFCGQGNYLNSFANSVTQLTYVYDQGANGSMNYSYYATRSTETICEGSDPWVSDTTWYSYVAANLFTSVVPTPAMPWNDPATATQGSVFGRVTDGSTGEPIDNATIKLGAFTVAETDGNGFYLYTPPFDPGGSGMTIPMGADHANYDEVARPAVFVERAGFTEANFALGEWLPGDYDVDADVDAADFVRFEECFTGPADGPIGAGCDLFDFDSDGDLDLSDFSVMQGSFTG